MRLILTSILLSVFLVIGAFKVFALTVTITANVPGCGNNEIDVGEQCDGSDLGGSTCSSLGFSSGSLSCSSVCTFNTSSCTSSGGGGGGGGSSTPSTPTIPDTNVVFTGRAYPLSKVTILKDGQIVVTTIAGPDSNFTATISGLSTGNYTFAVYGEDKNNIRSGLFTFPILITSGVTTKIGGIFIAPTIAVDKSEVKLGDNIAIFGQSSPISEITVSINSAEEFFIKKTTDINGAYLLNFDTSVLEMGQHHTKSKAALSGEISAFGKVVAFTVGTKNVLAETNTPILSKADVNGDNKVNLIDFSVTAYWYKRPNPPASADLNSDGKVDLVDFSILAFNWTG
jgi:hypothetical protein